MKNLILALPLLLGACVSAPPDLVRVDGALGRQVDRVLDRHDSYVSANLSLPSDVVLSYVGQSDAVRALAVLRDVRRDALAEALEPVAARHDAYVSADPVLDEARRSTYLASTEQLRRILKLE